jgi:hypothetical protein
MAIKNIPPSSHSPAPSVKSQTSTSAKTEKAQEKITIKDSVGKSTQSSSAQNSHDTVEVNKSKNYINELVDRVSNTTLEPREDQVLKAQQRVKEGFYNTEDCLGKVADKLLNPDTPSDKDSSS